MRSYLLLTLILLSCSIAHAETPGALAGHTMTLSPGHGLVWTGKEWSTQRPVYCAPLNEEDYHNLEMCQYLNTYLTQDGMTVKCVRCLDKNYGNHPSGNPWWKMASVYWLEHEGYPESVYSSLTHDPVTGSGEHEGNDDVRARPLASDYDNTEIFVSLHTNGLNGDCTTGDCPTGTCTYYDAGRSHAEFGEVSKKLSDAIQTSLISTIRNDVPLLDWADRGSMDSQGRLGEIRIPHRPASLTELAFHDTCNTDVVALRDNFFRSAAMWAMYKGICDYFDVKPTWDFYSDELVSHDIPSNLRPGETRTVHVTFRNRGVLWTEARQIRLGAVGNEDPFADTRRTISGEVGPNETYTFTFDMVAPEKSGFYATGWKMTRDGVAWFGPYVVKAVTVKAN
jgi:N-acetylmuramoyl-L-alanine amidase